MKKTSKLVGFYKYSRVTYRKVLTDLAAALTHNSKQNLKFKTHRDAENKDMPEAIFILFCFPFFSFFNLNKKQSTEIFS